MIMDDLVQNKPGPILVADDDPVSQQIIRHMLEHAGYEVATVGTGRAALDALHLRRYSVLLLDIQLPDMDGFAVARAIRSEFAGQDQPWIVALSAALDAGDTERCRASGMDDVLGKPLRMAALVACVGRGGAQTA